MQAPDGSNAVDTNHTPGRRFAFVAFLLALALLAVTLLPLWRPLLLACVMAAFVSRPNVWLTRRVRWPWIGSLIVTLAVCLAILLPVGALVAIAVDQGGDAWHSLRERVTMDRVRSYAGQLPAFARPAVERALANAGKAGQTIGDPAQLAKVASSSLTLLLTLATQAAVMVIALYLLLLDGRRLAGWLVDAVPLPPARTRIALAEFRKSARAVLGGNLGTAAAQAGVATVGYLVASAPQPLFFGLLTFFTSFFPAVGSAAVALPVAAIVGFSGHPGRGTFLLIWGVLAVGLIDNVVRPLLVNDGESSHGGLVFFAILGSLASFGAIGLIAGPLAVSAFVTLHKVWKQQSEA